MHAIFWNEGCSFIYFSLLLADIFSRECFTEEGAGDLEEAIRREFPPRQSLCYLGRVR